VILAISVFFAIQLPKTTLDNDVMNFVPADHPEAQAYERTADQFGSSMILGVGIEFRRETIFTAPHLELIRDLTENIEELENVEEVVSLSNTDFIAGTAEGMQVSPLMEEDFGGSREEILELKSKLLSWPDMYRDMLFSEDYTSTQIVVTFADGLAAEERQELYFAIEEIMEGVEEPPIEYYLAGNPAMTVLLSKNMRADMVTLIPMVIVVVLLALLLAFRKLEGVLISMITVLLSTIWTIGAMALLGVPLSMVATVIPVLMVAVGSAYGIHIISHYYDELRRRPYPADQESHREVVFAALRKVGKPVLLAGLTTVIGFGALITSQVIPMRNFGIFTAFGVLAAVTVAVLFIPSVLLVRKKHPVIGDERGEASDDVRQEARSGAAEHKLLMAFYHFFSTRRIRIVLLAVFIAAVGLYGTSKVIKDNAVIEYFKEDTTIREADRFLREKFSGTEFFDIIITGSKPGDLTNPEVLKAMDDLGSYLKETYPKVEKVNSFSDFIKRMNQVMNFPPAAGSDAAGGGAPAAGGQAQDGESAGFSSFADEQDDEGGGFSSFTDEQESGESTGFSVEEENSGDSGSARNGGDSAAEEGDESGGFSSFVDEESDAAGSGDEEYRKYLQPVQMDRQFTYEDFAVMVNEALAGARTMDMSVEEFVDRLNASMNYRGQAYYEIPYDPAKYPAESREQLKNLISQYLLLYSGSMENWADDALEPQKVKMTVQMSTTGTRETVPIVNAVHQYAERYFPEGYEVETSGSALVKNALTKLLIDAQTRSIIIALVLVFLIISVNFRSLYAGIFGLIPMGFAVIINFAVMGFLGIKLDISTAMVASLAIGIGIDYTIHFMSNYHYNRLRSDDLEQVTIRTLGTTGKAISFNAFSVAVGFLVLVFSNFNPLMYLGLLIALTMLTTSLTSMTLLPVLLNLFKPRFIAKDTSTLEKEVYAWK
jgi:hypothetical protein